MKVFRGRKTALSSAIAVGLASWAAAPPAEAADEEPGEYLTGDFHNHTTCSDGSTSVKTLTRESLGYLDWFIHVGHSGSGSRDCRIDDFIGLNRDSEFNRGLWVNSIGAENIKGDFRDSGVRTGNRVQNMWRWQSLQEFNFQPLVTEREAPGNEEKEAFLGLEWVVPGHEHSSNAVVTGQYGENANANAMAQFEYCFARNSDDTSQGGGQGWTCELTEASNAKLIELFDGRPEEGVADYNSTLVGGINIDDAGEHVKSVAAMLWLQDKGYADDSFSVQAHVERQGAFIPDDDEGYNVEHMRDAHTVAPEISFGFESQPGHQAQFSRGSYNAGRPTSGLYTFGGTGCYAGAEAARPGLDFDGNPLNPADFPALGISATQDPNKVTLCRPGVRTMWDAMLSEGRRFWFFASSDWHNRGAFGPLDFESTNDFWPGEYQEQYTYVVDRPDRDPAQDIVDGLRSGNSYAVQGQLIDQFNFEVCYRRKCAKMGESITVPKGEIVRVNMRIRDPKGKNNSPYFFNNPSLMQIGIEQPLDQPELAHVDLISGQVFEQISVDDPEYYNPLAPETTVIEHTWDKFYLRPSRRGVSRLTYYMVVSEDSYLRVRGSNIPAGTPNERDMYGNPLPDNLTDNIPCDDAACPPHIGGTLNADVEAWADIWFYSNPIFIDIAGKAGTKYVASN
ncbi:MAG: hypothetical protein AAFX56_16725 [Pseudomonadota bacterium]